MNQRAISHLEAVLPQSKFEFGKYISNGFEIWKKEAGSFIGFGFIFIILSSSASFVPYIGSVANNLVISPCLTAGAYYFSHKSRMESSAEFGQFFEKFQSFVPILIVNLIVAIVFLILCSPIVLSFGFDNVMNLSSGDPDTILSIMEDFNFTYLLLLIPALLLMTLVGFAVHFIIFYDLEPIDSLKYSIRFILKHWIIYILYMIVVVILACLGIIALFIGILITFTFLFPMSYEAFRGVTQLDKYIEPNEKDGVLDMLVEY